MQTNRVINNNDFFSQSCAVVPVCSPTQEGFDCFVLVCENLEWDNPTWEFLKQPIQAAAKVKVCLHG